jgi:hypothetical protein
MAAPLKSAKILVFCGAALAVLGFSCMFVASASTFSGNIAFLLSAWGVLSAAGFFFIIFGAIVLCTGARPKEIISFSSSALVSIILAVVLLAVLSPDANVHGPIMPVVLALVGFALVTFVAPAVGLIRLAIERRVPPTV